jgi:LL-H family phage holin
METQLLMDVLEIVVILVFSAIGRYLIPYLKNHISQQKMDYLILWAEKFVSMAENMIDTEKSGNEKRELVTKLLTEKAEELKVPLTEEQIRALIEDACTYLKNK